MSKVKKVIVVVELGATVVLGVLGTALFFIGFVALAGGNYWLSGLPFGSLAGLIFLAVVYERNRGTHPNFPVLGWQVAGLLFIAIGVCWLLFGPGDL